jgi:hypothetical protein
MEERLTGAGALTGGGASSSSLSLEELLEELLELEEDAAALAALMAASVWIADGSCLSAATRTHRGKVSLQQCHRGRAVLFPCMLYP